MARSTPAGPTASGKAARSGSTAAPPGAYSAWTAASASNSAMPRAVSILPTVDLPMPIEPRSEEHPSELQSRMRTSYAVACLKKQNKHYEQASMHVHEAD